MDLKTFFEHFDTLAEAPNGIQRLRELILDMAVRGKLVPQDPEDEPAHKLLKLQKIDESDPNSEEIPESWAWARFDQFLGIRGGSQPPKSTFSSIPEDGYIRLLQIRDFGKNPVPVYIPKDRAKRTCNEADVMLARYGASIGKVFMGQEGAYNVALTKILFNKNKFFNRYIFYLLKSSLFQRHLIDASRSAQAGFNKGDLQKVFLPVAPLAEQKRIVAKVDELMALCDALEAAQQTRNTLRQKLRASALDGLMNAPSNTDLETAWAFVSDNWGLMCDRPEDVEGLKALILDMAVRGKLVPQDPEDEPAIFLLKTIQSEIPKKSSQKKHKSQGPTELPFSLPQGWESVKLEDISTEIHYGLTASANHKDARIKFLRITDIQNDSVNWTLVPGCDVDLQKAQKYRLKNNDIVIARTGGTVGKSYLVESLSSTDFAVFASYLIRISPSQRINHSYLKLTMGTSLYWEQLADKTSGTGQPNVNATSLKSFILPLPPLAEQKRIVAKVDELMKLCDHLEASLRQQQQRAEALVASVVHHFADLA